MSNKQMEKMTLKAAREILKPLAMVLVRHDGEYKVKPCGGTFTNPAPTYFTDDLADAVQTGVLMAGERDVQRELERVSARRIITNTFEKEDARDRLLDMLCEGKTPGEAGEIAAKYDRWIESENKKELAE